MDFDFFNIDHAEFFEVVFYLLLLINSYIPLLHNDVSRYVEWIPVAGEPDGGREVHSEEDQRASSREILQG